jgi:hypothetical protein
MKALLLAALLVQTPLTNQDVVSMVRAGLSAEIIGAKIKASAVNFDTSPSALKELKGAGVPDGVLLAMLEPREAKAEKAPARYVPLADVRRILVSEMGNSDDASRFRDLLVEELAARGFTVVDSEEDADAILSGSIATQLQQGTTKARATARLKSPDGRPLWSDDFGVRFVVGFGRARDSVKLRAEDVASALGDAVKKAKKQSK